MSYRQISALKEKLRQLDTSIQEMVSHSQDPSSIELSLPSALFDANRHDLKGCRRELQTTFDCICEQLQRNKNETILQYYCERFAEQYTAILRALEHSRRSRAKSQTRPAARYKRQVKTLLAPSHKLYQDLAQHHEYERRLLDMVRDKEMAANTATNAQQYTNELLALKARLGRCRQAIARIEDAIKSAEQG